MIHVTSSGAVTAGASVMDAFIRDRIAGGADDYDADWKAEARNLPRKRVDEPDAAAAANRAAEEMMGLSRPGVRAMALDHTAIATHIRNGDQDPTILAIPGASRTTEQAVTLAEQGMLSAAERTVLASVLTGGELAAAGA